MNLTELVSFFAEDPVIAWFALLALMLILVPLGQALRRRKPAAVKSRVASAAESRAPFGNRIEILILLIGLALVAGILGGMLFP